MAFETTITEAEATVLREMIALAFPDVPADSVAAVNQSALPDTSILYAEVAVTSAELLALFTTPKELVAAPGAGYVLEFISAVFILDYGTATYATNGNLTIAHDTTAVSDALAEGDFLFKTADSMSVVQALSADVILAENKAINLTLATGNPATGDGVVRVKVAYRKHATGL